MPHGAEDPNPASSRTSLALNSIGAPEEVMGEAAQSRHAFYDQS
jgi:hypothetical protein